MVLHRLSWLDMAAAADRTKPSDAIY